MQLRRCETFGASDDAGIRTRLQIGFTSSMLAFDLQRLVTNFERQHPQVSIELIEMPVDQQLQELHHHRPLAGFCPSLTAIDRFESLLLIKQRYACCVPAGHPCAGQQVVALAQLRDEAFIAFARDPLRRGIDQTSRMCAAAGFPRGSRTTCAVGCLPCIWSGKAWASAWSSTVLIVRPLAAAS